MSKIILCKHPEGSSMIGCRVYKKISVTSQDGCHIQDYWAGRKMQMGAAKMGKRFEQHFVNYQNTKAILESIVYLYTTPSMQLPTNSQRSSLDRLRLLLLHRTKMRIQSPCQPSTMKHPKNRRSSTYQIHSERRREGDAAQTQRSCGKRIHRDREEIA